MSICCPTEAQIVALLDRHATQELRAYSQWCGESTFWLVVHAVYEGDFTWRELFYETEYALAQGFDNWHDEFRDILDCDEDDL